jgi:dTMP kinase
MALLFALDRRAAAAGLRETLATHDLVLVDRYVASNAAYGAARLHQDACGGFVAWVHDLEIGRFRLPLPDRHLLLDVPRSVAAQRAEHRERTQPGRARDRYESDAGLQDRTADVYRRLAATGWLAPWTVLDGTAGLDQAENGYAALAADLMG